MKRLFTLCTMVIALGTVVMAGNTYQKVTSTPTDWTGTYLIVCEAQSVIFNGAADSTNIDAKCGPAIISGVSLGTSGTLEGTAKIDSAAFTIVATDDEDWPWAIQSASGLYIGHKDTADNGLSAEIEIKNKCKHTLAIDESSNFIATPKHTAASEYNLQYNIKSDQMRFRYFVPEDKVAIQIYKLQSPTTDIESAQTSAQAIKRYENGRIVIYKNGQKYNVLGAKL